MAEPFKNLIHAGTVHLAAEHLARHAPGFPRARFEQLALAGLDRLEMKARAMQIASALEATLPDDFDLACTVIEASLAPPISPDQPAGGQAGAAGLAGWVVWSLGEYVARRGLAAAPHVPRALAALHALTQRFSAEFAIRPFLRDHPQTTFQTLTDWLQDPSDHVRRLVSEGSRPRLPWGLRLQALVKDPSPTLPLLRALQDDTSEYVRRSVANHLNDIAKDHPGLVAEWLETHLPGAPAPRRALLKHASRSLIKAGDLRVLGAWGLGQAFKGRASLSLDPPQARVGDALALEVNLHSLARRPQDLVIDYAVHHVKANGSTSPKVFKGWSLSLAPGESRTLVRRHSLRPVTTRRYFAGAHRVELLVNGVVQAEARFELALDEAPAP